MTTNPQMPDRLTQLGEALDHAVRADLAAGAPALRRLRRPRRAAVGVAIVAVAAPAVAIAATQLITTGQVAASLPQGTKALIGTDPTCTVVTANVEYHCVLAKASDPGPPPSLGRGTVTSTLGSGEPSAAVTLSNGRQVVIGAATDSALKQKILRLEHGTGNATGNAVVHTSNPPAPANTDWTGTVEATVDASKHVNGGCRAQNASGTQW